MALTIGGKITVGPGISVTQDPNYIGAVVAAINASPYVAAWAWSDATGFGTRYSDPSTLPAGIGRGVAFNPTGTSVAVVHSTTPTITVYSWSNATGFGTKYANPGTLPIGTSTCVAWSNSGTTIFVGNSSGDIQAWPWSDATGFGTKYSNGSTTVGSDGLTGVAVTSGDSAVIGSIDVSTRPLQAWAWSDATGFGTKYTDAVTGSSFFGNLGIAFNKTTNGAVAALGSTLGAKGVAAWPWDNATGFGTRYSAPAVGDAQAGYGGAFNKAGNALAVASSYGNAPYDYICVWAWSDATGFGTPYAAPSVIPSATGRSIAFTPNDRSIILGTSLSTMEAWAWNNSTGFGAKFSNASTPPQGDPISIAVWPTEFK